MPFVKNKQLIAGNIIHTNTLQLGGRQAISSFPFTAPSDGIVMASVEGSAGGAVESRFYIGGILIASCYTPQGQNQSCTFAVTKGQTVTASENPKRAYFTLFIQTTGEMVDTVLNPNSPNPIANSAVTNRLDAIDTSTVLADANKPTATIARYNQNTLNTPYTEGLSSGSQGLIISYIVKNEASWNGQIAIENGSSRMFIRSAGPVSAGFTLWKLVNPTVGSQTNLSVNTANFTASGDLFYILAGDLCIVRIAVKVNSNATEGDQIIASGLPVAKVAMDGMVTTGNGDAFANVWVVANKGELHTRVVTANKGKGLYGQIVYFVK